MSRILAHTGILSLSYYITVMFNHAKYYIITIVINVLNDGPYAFQCRDSFVNILDQWII